MSRINCVNTCRANKVHVLHGHWNIKHLNLHNVLSKDKYYRNTKDKYYQK